MTVLKYILLLFFIPAFVDVFYKGVSGRLDFDFVLILVAVVTSAVGTWVQITHKGLSKDLLRKEILAICSSSAFFIIVSYFLGIYFNNVFVTALVGTVASYMSLELLLGIKKAIIDIVKLAPKLTEMYFKNKYNIEDKEKEDEL